MMPQEAFGRQAGGSPCDESARHTNGRQTPRASPVQACASAGRLRTRNTPTTSTMMTATLSPTSMRY